MTNQEFQNLNCKVMLSEKKLLIKVDFRDEARIYLYLILIPLIGLIFLFINFLSDVIMIIIFYCTIYLIISPFVVGYFYCRKRIIEWSFDKAGQIIKEVKVSPRFKELLIIPFSDINYFYFQREAFDYSLKFAIRDITIVKIYEDGKNTCKELGIIIAKFTNKPLYYKEGNWRDKIYGQGL